MDGIRPRSRANETTAAQPFSAVQGQGGAGCHQRRPDVVQLAQRFDIHPNQITQWKAELLERAGEVFATAAERREAGPDLKALHAKIGQQALEIDFLAGALGRTDDASAKR